MAKRSENKPPQNTLYFAFSKPKEVLIRLSFFISKTSHEVIISLFGLISTISWAKVLVTPTKSTIPDSGTLIAAMPLTNGSISLS